MRKSPNPHDSLLFDPEEKFFSDCLDELSRWLPHLCDSIHQAAYAAVIRWFLKLGLEQSHSYHVQMMMKEAVKRLNLVDHYFPSPSADDNGMFLLRFSSSFLLGF